MERLKDAILSVVINKGGSHLYSKTSCKSDGFKENREVMNIGIVLGHSLRRKQLVLSEQSRVGRRAAEQVLLPFRHPSHGLGAVCTNTSIYDRKGGESTFSNRGGNSCSEKKRTNENFIFQSSKGSLQRSLKSDKSTTEIFRRWKDTRTHLSAIRSTIVSVGISKLITRSMCTASSKARA